MSSVHERIPWAGHINYAAAKGGVRMLAQTLAQEVAADRIRVNAVAPGAIRTPINKKAWDTVEALRKLLELVPLAGSASPKTLRRQSHGLPRMRPITSPAQPSLSMAA
jgi:glucose 1-dehydrogenase